ncbi:MAG: DHA2 family efflux MFS transporter permease subunit [Acidobacteriia bacterium]|nr:DHA2 family efflux MFS transporter permease subunit [Terriglobia bacterium]
MSVQEQEVQLEGPRPTNGVPKWEADENFHADGTPRVNPWLIAVTVTMATFMEVLDTSVANVALPHIAGNLSASVDEATWVLTSYLVSNAIILPISPWLGGLIGRKRFYQLCVILFTVSSLLCGLAPSLSMLIFFRVLQGVGGGGLQPTEQAILFESFPHEKRGMAAAVYGMGVLFAPIIGPTLGGWITDNYSWRWIFFINIPVGALSVFMTQLVVFDPPYIKALKKKLGRIDTVGLGLLAVGLGFLQIILDKGQREDWFESGFIWRMTVCSAAALIFFVIWELRTSHPVVNFSLMKDRTFATGMVLIFMTGFVLYGSIVLLPIYLQGLMGYTAVLSGLVISPGGIATLLLMPVVGRLMGTKLDPRLAIAAGFTVTAISVFQMSHFNLELGFANYIWPRIVQGIGLAFIFIPVNTVAFASLQKERMNDGTGLFNLMRNLGGSFGIAIVATTLSRRQQVQNARLGEHLNPFNPNFQWRLNAVQQGLASSGMDPASSHRTSMGFLQGLMQRQAYMNAFVEDFWILGVAMLAMLPLLFLMRRPKPGSEIVFE